MEAILSRPQCVKLLLLPWGNSQLIDAECCILKYYKQNSMEFKSKYNNFARGNAFVSVDVKSRPFCFGPNVCNNIMPSLGQAQALLPAGGGRAEGAQQITRACYTGYNNTSPNWCSRHYNNRLQNKQRVLMHRHQGWNVRHGLCHIYMRYVYIYELFIAFVCFVVCSLL